MFYAHFMKRKISGCDVMYEFYLKDSQFIYNGDFERKFVDSLHSALVF